MGQYYKIVNHDAKEYVQPSPMKLIEISHNDGALLPYLLRESDGRGGGDPSISYADYPKDEDGNVDLEKAAELQKEMWPNEGRWAGDRISVVGDYSDTDLWDKVERDPEWTNITDPVLEEARAFLADPCGRGDAAEINPHMSPDIVA